MSRQITLESLRIELRSHLNVEDESESSEQSRLEAEQMVQEAKANLSRLASVAAEHRIRRDAGRIAAGKLLASVLDDASTMLELVPCGTMRGLCVALELDVRRAGEWLALYRASVGEAKPKQKRTRRLKADSQPRIVAVASSRTAEQPSNSHSESSEWTRPDEETQRISTPVAEIPAACPEKPMDQFVRLISEAVAVLPDGQVLAGVEKFLAVVKGRVPQAAGLLDARAEEFTADVAPNPVVMATTPVAVGTSKTIGDEIRDVELIRSRLRDAPPRLKTFDAAFRKILNVGNETSTRVSVKAYLPTFPDDGAIAVDCARKELKHRMQQFAVIRTSTFQGVLNRDKVAALVKDLRIAAKSLEERVGLIETNAGKLFSIYPDELDNPEFIAEWEAYIAVLCRRGAGPDQKWRTEKLTGLAKLGPELAVRCVHEAACKGYWKVPGVDFEVKELGGKKYQPIRRTQVDYDQLTSEELASICFMQEWEMDRAMCGLSHAKGLT